ncbi:inorganic phosphate transporter PHO84 [Candidozyma auris]|nr:inorganic phosphate transporter PHO84 [[Candida] auris]
MLDIAYYGLGLNTAVILEAIGYAADKNIYKGFWNTAVGNLILVCAGSLPGYWVAAATVDTVGRKPIQLMGFVLLTIFFCILGFANDKLGQHGKLALYVLCQFFENFGPNTTTFIVPGECFPTRYRSSAHGISAAAGKVGAIVAQTCLGTLVNHGCAKDDKNCFLPHVIEIFALFMLLGCFTTLLIPETKRMTLEEICEKYHDEVDTTKLGADRYVTQQAESSDSDLKQ